MLNQYVNSYKRLVPGYEAPVYVTWARRNRSDLVRVPEYKPGKEIATRPFQLVTGRVWRGSAFGGARGRTDTPKIVDWYMDGKIEIDPMITHTFPLEEINKAFDLMHAGESIRSVVVF